MGSWKMKRNSSSDQRQLVALKCIPAVLLLFCSAVPVRATKFTHIFTFGDSYVDNENRDPNNSTKTAIGKVNQDWHYPYGRTNPAKPGRFSDGKVLSDYLSSYMSLNPRPYRLRNNSSESTRIEDGMNFAIGGAGVFNNLGFTKTGDQIAQLEALVNAGWYTSSVYNESLIFYTISGNDYATYVRNGGSMTDVVSIATYISSVVNQCSQDLTMLYNLGFKNFIVSKVPPLGCLPNVTRNYGYSECYEPYNTVSESHNTLLTTKLATSLSNASLLYFDIQLAFSDKCTGRLKPCCVGKDSSELCGDVDSNGEALYTLCNSTSSGSYFFWDEFHPTQASWSDIFDLFLQGSPYTYTDGKSLPSFLGIGN